MTEQSVVVVLLLSSGDSFDGFFQLMLIEHLRSLCNDANGMDKG